MEKKFNFNENPTASKIIYGIVVAILATAAIVVGIISAASTKDKAPEPDNSIVTPPSDEGDNGGTTGEDNTPKPTVFTSPMVGEVTKSHSMEIPVFSNTLGLWKVHTGIDISAEEGAEVFSAAGGEVVAIYEDALMGLTVEVQHTNDIKTVYSNLAKDGSIAVSVGDKLLSGAKIGHIGDSAISELADEAHLHFEVLVKGVPMNPLDYISEASKKSALGIES